MEFTPTERRLKGYVDAVARALGSAIVLYLAGILCLLLWLVVLSVLPIAPNWLGAFLVPAFLVGGLAPLLLPVVVRSYRRTVSGPDAAKHPYHHFRRIDGIGRGVLFLIVLELSAYSGLLLASALGVEDTPAGALAAVAFPLALFLGLSYWYYRKLY